MRTNSARNGMKTVLIVKTGSAPQSIRRQHGDFEDWFQRLLSPQALPVTCVDATSGDLPDPALCSGAVITGSSAMVTDHPPWSDRCAGWLQNAYQAKLPLLGVCYGHQLLACALGGAVADNVAGRIIGGYRFQAYANAANDPLLGALPTCFAVQKTHCQRVVALPHDAICLGRTPGDPYSAFRLGAHAWGMQFHPEFSLEVALEYILARRTTLEAEGLDVEAALASTTQAEDSTAVIGQFANYCALHLTDAPDSLQGRA